MRSRAAEAAEAELAAAVEWVAAGAGWAGAAPVVREARTNACVRR
jgi:hypothetical protein